MAEKYVPMHKRSKKEQRADAASRRGSWNGVNPVTRKPACPQIYNRRRFHKESEDEKELD